MLRIPSPVRLAYAGADRICWITEQKQGIWTAPHAGTLANLLATPSAADAVLETFAVASRDQAAQTIASMISMGLLESCALSPHLSRICREFRVSPEQLERKRWLQGATIIAINKDMGDALESALAVYGVLPGQGGCLTILAVDDYLDDRIDRISRTLRESGTPWMLARLAGEEAWAGPIFIPDREPCWHCLAIRLREHRWLESQLAVGAVGASMPYFEAHRARAATEFAAHQAASWLLEAPDSLEGAVWTFSWASLDSRRHFVRPQRACPFCHVDTERTAASAFFVTGSPRAVSGNMGTCSGDLRTQTVSQILERLDPLSSPITGILRRFEPASLTLPEGMFAYGAAYCPPLPPKELRMPGTFLQPAVTSGLGWSVEEAKAACLAEAIERYSARFHGEEKRLSRSYQELAGAAVSPSEVILFSDNQFSSRETWNREHILGEWTPEPFDENEKLEWMEGWSLTGNRPRFVPLALCKSYYRPHGNIWIGDADSSGCAAGSCMEEAILHALFELVERDALGIWWFNRIERPAVLLDCITDLRTIALCRQLAARGWRVRLHDVTTDIAIPSAVVIAENPAGEWVLGSAAHLSRDIAIRHAVTELWQLAIARVRPGPAPAASGEAGPPTSPAPAEFGLLAHGQLDLPGAVAHCSKLLARAGHEVIAIDLSRPDLQFPVVRIVAPGLRHKKPRFAPGRLYDVPVRLGWLASPNRECDMRTVGV